jgi:hypothetical protein
MSSNFVIVVENASKEQRDTITHRLKGTNFGLWHWIETMWLVTGVEDGVTPKSFCEWLEQTPGIDGLTYIVLKVNGPCPYWGRNNEKAWDWMSKNWGKPSS